MSKKHEPHIVVFEILDTWTVESFSSHDEAMKQFIWLEDKVDAVFLAKVLRKHVGPFYEEVWEDDV